MRMNISVPDELAAEVRERSLPISAVCQRALSAEVHRLRSLETARKEMEPIVIDVGLPARSVGFTGRWLVEADIPESYTSGGYDEGGHWRVAQTQKGRIAVYKADYRGVYPPQLDDYDTLDEAANDGVPEDVIQDAAAVLGVPRILWRDI